MHVGDVWVNFDGCCGGLYVCVSKENYVGVCLCVDLFKCMLFSNPAVYVLKG